MAQIIPVDPFDYIVFGGTGDLAIRKLMPALYYRFKDGQFDTRSRLIAVSRSSVSHAAYHERVYAGLEAHIAADDLDLDVWAQLKTCIFYVSIDVASDGIRSDGWGVLQEILATEPEKIRVFYLATKPDLFGTICHQIESCDLKTSWSRVVLEKPIGRDLKTAQVINDAVSSVFEEEQIFRIDHYLGKETVQNLMAFRFANALFEPVWNSQYIDHVQITVAESVGVEGRAGYYDTSGALRDMVQNHLLQLLCLVAMEPPQIFGADPVRDEKLKVLQALKPLTEQAFATSVVRGQYKFGLHEDQPVSGYDTDLGAESTTETFVALKVEVENWRWAGVPFYIRTGKRLPTKVSEIVIQFRTIPHSIFPDSAGDVQANTLVVRLQPDEGIRMYLMSKDPGPGGLRLRQTPLNLSFTEAFQVRYPDAYERLLMDVVRDNLTLFMRRDEVEQAWIWTEPLLAYWDQAQRVSSHGLPLPYASGTWGPRAAAEMMHRDRRAWYQMNGYVRRETGPTRDDLVARLARHVNQRLCEGIQMHGTASLVVSGGQTPAILFRVLAQMQDVDWSRVTVTLADERWVSRDHADSNARLVWETLLQGAASAATFVPLYVDKFTPEEAEHQVSSRIQDVLKSSGGSFDTVLLGMGTDGHTASLFPVKSPQTPEGGRLRQLLDPYATAICATMRPDTTPLPRMTLTAACLLRARDVGIFVIGDDKQSVLRIAEASGPVTDMPVRFLLRQNFTPVTIWAAP